VYLAALDIKKAFDSVNHNKLFSCLLLRGVPICIITFCVSRRRSKMYCGHARLCVCLSVCLSAAVRPQYCTDPDVTSGHGRGCPLVVHYWADLQSGHLLRCYGNITRTLVTSLRPSRDIVRTAGWAGSARAAGRRPPGNRGRTQNRAPHTEAGAAGPPPTGAFSTLLRQSGLRTFTGGVLATKSERKMLASTCLYSLYAWLMYCVIGIVNSLLELGGVLKCLR